LRFTVKDERSRRERVQQGVRGGVVKGWSREADCMARVGMAMVDTITFKLSTFCVHIIDKGDTTSNLRWSLL